MDDQPEEFMRSYVPRAKVTKDHMWEVFHSVPKMRAMAVDNASYEELQALYHGSDDYRLTLWNLVCEFNNGTIHPSRRFCLAPNPAIFPGCEREKKKKEIGAAGAVGARGRPQGASGNFGGPHGRFIGVLTFISRP